MPSFRFEPFLWIHLAGIAALLICLELVWLGLAVGDPLPLGWLEMLLVATIGIVPILWMQLSRPFDIFSLLFVALKPEQTNETQRKILSLFKTNKQRVLSIIGAIVMVILLWQIYRIAPLAETTAKFLPQWRIIGLGIATVAFFLSNLFLQVPISVLGVLVTSQQTFDAIAPYPVEEITRQFTVFGFRVNKILPLKATEAL